MPHYVITYLNLLSMCIKISLAKEILSLKSYAHNSDMCVAISTGT